jgi:hypothetical protein
LGTSQARAFLTSRLSKAFGRPVEVGSYHFTLLDGPRVEARYVTVGDDPRFGFEYFLRAEALTAGPRWRSLLQGRFDFGTLTLTRPSLNLVRLPDGRWNIEHWLPPLESSRAPGAAPRAPAPPYALRIDAGRINFTRGADKHPFALVDVSGRVDQETGGRWRIDLEAHLSRAAVDVQEAGTLRVRGRVGGTSARLRPAELIVTWQEASLADALRLLRGWDFGVRGDASLEFTATSSAPVGPALLPPWEFAGTLRVLDLHRWDLPHRPSDPALNLHVNARWWPERARVEFDRTVFEAARSNLRASGHLEWALPGASSLRVVSSAVDLGDVFAFYRALRPGVNENLSVEGNAGADIELEGWPPRIARGVIATDGARLGVPGLAAPLGVGRAALRIKREKIELGPLALTLPGARDSLRLDGAAATAAGGRFVLNFGGQTSRVQDLLALRAALGGAALAGWTLEGRANLRLRWQGTLVPFSVQRFGFLDLQDARLQTSLLAEPVALTARWEWLGDGERIAVTSAATLGARWNGTLASRRGGEPWEVALAVDQLDVAAANRAIRREPAGFLERVVPGRRATPEALAQLDSIRAAGRIAVGRLVLAPLEVRRVRARIDWRGRRLELAQGEGDFYGGTLRGSFRAAFADPPVYDAALEFSSVDVLQLAGASAVTRGRLAGRASGEIALAARGAARDALLDSLEGGGVFEARDAQFRGLQLAESLAAGRALPGTSVFRSAAGAFRIAGRGVEFRSFKLTPPSAGLDVSGRADAAGALDFVLAPPSAVRQALSSVPPKWRLTGTLAAPRLAIVETASPPRP